MLRRALLLTLAGCGLPLVPAPSDGGAVYIALDAGSLDGGDPCAVTGLTDFGALGNVNMLGPSPDFHHWVVNRKDSSGVFQVFVGDSVDAQTCISCTQTASGPSPDKNKVMTLWSPLGWITVGVEMDAPAWPWLCDQSCKDGLLISGINVDLWAVKPDGSQWVLLKKWDPAQPSLGQGFTGPAFTPDGKHGYWADIVDGDIFVYSFGKWRLQRSDFAVDENGLLTMTNTTDVTPSGASWMEPGNISPDGKKLLFNSDIGLQPNAAFGQDQFVLDLESGSVTNLTRSDKAWDEHGLFSPDGKKVVWMSSGPYPDATWVGNLRTDFMLMDADGSNARQLTHFNEPGFAESQDAGTVAAVAFFSADGKKLYASDQWAVGTQRLLVFDFAGACGLQP